MFLNNYCYILLNYKSVSLHQCLYYYLFISLMQSVNGAQFLNISFLLPLFATAGGATMFGTDIVPLKSIYVSLEVHKLDFNKLVLNFIWLLVLYIPPVSSFISSQFFVLNLDVNIDVWYSVILLSH